MGCSLEFFITFFFIFVLVYWLLFLMFWIDKDHNIDLYLLLGFILIFLLIVIGVTKLILNRRVQNKLKRCEIQRSIAYLNIPKMLKEDENYIILN